MPEYLAPDVYVEEIDTGSKPIEGVSTSTAGMLGMAERGPVDVPILVTSYGEYTRWFGERLDPDVFGDTRCHLPHAVEGFFTNGGKRLYVVRVLDTAAASFARTMLFDRDAVAGASTRLLAGVGTSPATNIVYVLDDTGLAATVPPTWVQVGDGSTAEFRTVAATAAPHHVPLRLPLDFGYDAASATVDHFPAAAVTVAASPALAVDADAGAQSVMVDFGAPGNVAAGSLIRLGSHGDDEEFAICAANAAGAGAFSLPLAAPLRLPHPVSALATVDVLDALPAPAGSTTLAAPGLRAAAGGCLLFVALPAGFQTADDIVRMSDGTHTEIRRIGELSTLACSVPAYGDYPAGATVDAVTLADDATTARHLATDVRAGSTVLDLDNRDGLAVGGILRIGPAGPQCEYLLIDGLPNLQASPNAGKVVLAAPLQLDHLAPSDVHQQLPVPADVHRAASIAIVAPKGSATMLVTEGAFSAADAIRVAVGDATYFHVLSAAAAAAHPVPVSLDANLDMPHVAGESVVARTPLLSVHALDQGAWGNRLRVSVRDSDPPLVRGRIRSVQDGIHLRLDSANGVEPGTVLLRVDAAGAVLSAHKVVELDRRSDNLIRLDAATPLPGAAAVGDAVRSQEFQLDVYLMRQPDPAVPSRSESVLAAETFPQLSLDPRHSRYLHKVIGTTWTPGTAPPVDDDGRPLRKSDHRSEGASWLVRVRDMETDENKQRAVRMGPTPLVDALPGGSLRPARIPLAPLGDDAASTVADATYIGHDDVEPELRTGLFALRNEEDISILACPGRTGPALQQALIDHCENMRYRFAVLDGPRPPDDTLVDVQALRQQYDSKYAALYHPWLVVPEPFPASRDKLADWPIPPSGHVLGVYARTDVERGVHKAPANEVVRGITGLQRKLNKGEQDILNPFPQNINVIRDFRSDSRGIRVYGGRVITSDPDWKYVNVRRLMIFIEASIYRGLQWVVFEPNAEPLWARVRRSISNFLTQVWRSGGLEGSKTEEAFFVKCDRTTMTQTDIDEGRLICVVGVAPVKPAEFVIVRIGLWTAHAED